MTINLSSPGLATPSRLRFRLVAAHALAGRLDSRTFLLRGDGFSKEMDIHSASPDTVEPLPYHGMPGYPYGTDRTHYPDTIEHNHYRDTYNTRPVTRPGRCRRWFHRNSP